jgi:peptidoglycan/xylan/chitin deacetylase (PgdA/CDA1 family)
MIRLDQPSGVVSFSFDDAPQSACIAGAQALENHNCRGTWYIAGGLTDQYELGMVCHSMENLQHLKANGHHIACHTYSHKPCTQRSGAQLQEDFRRNRDFLVQNGLAQTPLHFSFPLGAFDLESKRLASEAYVSCRITGGGVQSQGADLNGLKSERLYDNSIDQDQILTLMRRTAACKGWLIFYTHDVSDTPGPFGCSPSLLDFAIQAALAEGCQVLPVNEAIQYWQGQPRAANP